QPDLATCPPAASRTPPWQPPSTTSHPAPVHRPTTHPCARRPGLGDDQVGKVAADDEASRIPPALSDCTRPATASPSQPKRAYLGGAGPRAIGQLVANSQSVMCRPGGDLAAAMLSFRRLGGVVREGALGWGLAGLQPARDGGRVGAYAENLHQLS